MDINSPWYKLVNFGLEFFGKYYSSYRGFVVDNDDPKKLNRIKVISPIIGNDSSDGVWAYPKGIYSGNNHGVNLLPLKGEMVWLEFEHGDSKYPIWSHHTNKLNQKPSEFYSPYVYGFKSPSGHLVIINDIEDEEYILLKHNNLKDYILLLKDTIELESKLIKLGKNGDEQAVLGNTLKAKLDNVIELLKTNIDIINQHKHTTPNGPSGPPTSTFRSQFNNVKSNLNSVKGEFINFLSKKVKLDK